MYRSFALIYLYLINSQLVAKLARRDEIESLQSSRKNDEQTDYGFDNDETDALVLFDALGFEFEDVPDDGKKHVHCVLFIISCWYLIVNHDDDLLFDYFCI